MTRPTAFGPTKAISLVLLIGGLSGCSTIQTHSSGNEITRPYSGTSKAIERAKRSWENYGEYRYYGVFELHAMDIPASLIADTLGPVEVSFVPL